MFTNGKVDKKSWYLHTMEYYSAIKRNAMLIHVTTWLHLQNVVLYGEKPKPNRHTLDEVYYRGKKPETKSLILCEGSYMQYPEQVNPYGWKAD